MPARSPKAAYVASACPQRVTCACVCASGGGSALLHASKVLEAVKEKLTNFDQKIGVQIIQVRVV